MRKIVIVSMALAVGIGFSTFGASSALAGEAYGPQTRNGMYVEQASEQNGEFNSYWFVHGVPPYKDGVEPWKRTDATQERNGTSGFDSYWFVYGVPRHDGGRVNPDERSDSWQKPGFRSCNAIVACPLLRPASHRESKS